MATTRLYLIRHEATEENERGILVSNTDNLLMYEEAYAGKIDIIKGIEIGIQHGKTINKCKYIAGSFGYDFIIGSFHCFNGHDLYKYEYVREKTEKTVMEFYEYMLSCLEQFNNYDVLGHFNIIDRYLPYVPDYDQYMDVIAAILRLLIRNGKGIEINTSSFRYGMCERTTGLERVCLCAGICPPPPRAGKRNSSTFSRKAL